MLVGSKSLLLGKSLLPFLKAEPKSVDWNSQNPDTGGSSGAADTKHVASVSFPADSGIAFL